jgi:hypothetical protein
MRERNLKNSLRSNQFFKPENRRVSFLTSSLNYRVYLGTNMAVGSDNSEIVRRSAESPVGPQRLNHTNPF